MGVESSKSFDEVLLKDVTYATRKFAVRNERRRHKARYSKVIITLYGKGCPLFSLAPILIILPLSIMFIL